MRLFISIIIFLFLFYPYRVDFAFAASKLMLSKSIPHYSDEMEFYYLRPRPKVLADLLKNLANSGLLAQNEKQLMVAAFFASLAMDNKLNLEKFSLLTKGLGRDACRTIAWSAHLACHKSEKNILSTLLDSNDAMLLQQISKSPAPLNKWDIFAEPAIMQMYWGAFMASGTNKWLDPIINAALLYGRLDIQGLWRQSGYQVGRMAASSLYEYAPRHPRVKKRLEYFFSKSKGMDEVTLRKILRK